MSWETALDRQIHDYLPDLKWAADEPMAKHTSFRIGGPAKRMAFPKTREQLVVLMGFLQEGRRDQAAADRQRHEPARRRQRP